MNPTTKLNETPHLDISIPAAVRTRNCDMYRCRIIFTGVEKLSYFHRAIIRLGCGQPTHPPSEKRVEVKGKGK